MKLLDVYALTCGAKIDKCFIYEQFFPVPIERYITFQAQSQQNLDAKSYSYWQDVIEMITPILSQHGISIIQIGQNHESFYRKVFDLRGKTSINQLAYIMRSSALHFGPDSFGVHLAAHYDVPIVALYSSTMPEIAGPHFGSPEKQVLFKCYERIGNKKPSFALQENPKSINTVYPEEIASAILKLLEVPFVFPLKTVFMGARYSNLTIRELIPNNPNLLGNPEAPVEIRYDKGGSEQLLAHHLNYLNKGVIVTDKPINIDLLRHFKPHMPMLVYRVTEENNTDFLKQVISLGINVILTSTLPQETIRQKKIDYYEFGVVNQIEQVNEELKNKFLPILDNLYFKSCKILFSDGKPFFSHASKEANIEVKNEEEYQKVIDSPLFWKDLDFYTLVEKLS